MSNNFPIKLQYVPLTFINTDDEKIRQIKNTIINKHVLLESNEIKKLSELIINTQYGYTASAKPVGNYKLLRITDIKKGKVNWDNVPFCECEYPEKYLLKPNDVLIARTGNNISYLVSNDVPANAIFASYLIRFKCNDKLYPQYFFTFLNSYAFWSQILAKQQGALLQNVNAKRMGELLIPYCSREKQKEILDRNTKVQQDLQKTINRYNSVNSISSESRNQSTYLSKLRQAILQEAIEGKLTADWRKKNPVRKGDPDYDAKALLEKIQAEKEKLIKEGKIKKQKPLAPIKAEEVPFELPEGWVWTRLGEISEGFQYGSSAKSLKEGKVPVLRMGNIQDGKIDWNDLVYTNNKNEIEQYVLKKGDLLFNRTNSRELVGKTAVFDGLRDAIFAGYLVRFSPLAMCSSEYFNFIMNSSLHREWCNKNKTDAIGQSNINATKLRDFIFPLAPLAEQQAIVDRVKNLFSMVDELEKQVTERKEQSEQLMQAVLREAFEGANHG